MQKLSLDTPGIPDAVAKRVSEEIDKYCQGAYDDGHRNHLGASLIGDDCSRKLWYSFRWVFKERFSGRLLRLFNRGHREEDRFVEWLEGAGFKVWAHSKDLWYSSTLNEYKILDINADLSGGTGSFELVTNKSEHVKAAAARGIKIAQFRVSGSKGHFGGSLDGIAKFPPAWGIDEAVLLEFKTNGTGKGFNDLVAKKMPVAKPVHYSQTSTYGGDPNYKFRFVLYLNINKNDDTIHIELAKLDWNLGEQMRAKADRIIFSQTALPRLSDNPTYWKCTGCAFSPICHDDMPAEVNCRSCRYAVPIENAQWQCTHDRNAGYPAIPIEVIKTGCDLHSDITKENVELL